MTMTHDQEALAAAKAARIAHEAMCINVANAHEALRLAKVEARRAFRALAVAENGGPKRPWGHPAGSRRVNVSLDEDTIRAAQALGMGNLSAGLRIAVAAAKNEGNENEQRAAGKRGDLRR